MFVAWSRSGGSRLSSGAISCGLILSRLRRGSIKVACRLARLVSQTTQQALFDLTARLGAETPMLSQIQDKQIRPLVALAKRAEVCSDDLRRATMLIELAALTEAATARAIRRANASGTTWREIGSRLGLPYQSLHRIYREDGQ